MAVAAASEKELGASTACFAAAAPPLLVGASILLEHVRPISNIDCACVVGREARGCESEEVGERGRPQTRPALGPSCAHAAALSAALHSPADDQPAAPIDN